MHGQTRRQVAFLLGKAVCTLSEWFANYHTPIHFDRGLHRLIWESAMLELDVPTVMLPAFRSDRARATPAMWAQG